MTKNFLQACVEKIRQREAYLLESAKECTVKNVQHAEKQAQILPDLQRAGYLLNVNALCPYGTNFIIDLEWKKEGQLTELRQLLGCKLEYSGKDVPMNIGKKKLVRISLDAKDWPVTIRYFQKVKRSDKCRIVTRKSTYKTIVCD